MVVKISNSAMASSKVVICLVFVTVVLCAHIADGHRLTLSRFLERQKRMSDQRLAELETMIALQKMKHKLITVPVGFGRIDPNRIGRRRRSAQKLLRTLIQDSSTEQDNMKEVETEDNRLDDDNLIIKLLYNEELRNRLRTSPD